MDNYLEINQKLWDAKVDAHVASDFYQNESFLKGRNTLNEIELGLLGDVKGLSVLHLQCHFGQDTISLSRMGAKTLGVDLSPKAIEKAREFAKATNTDAQFLWSDVYKVPAHVDGKFDMVFTTYGTIGWLPDLDKWARVISCMLNPGGKLVFAEFHPVVWMFDIDFNYVQYNYFQDEAIVETAEGTYTDGGNHLIDKEVSWNHSLGEVFQALKHNNIQVTDFKEYDYSPYNCFKNMEEFEQGKFRLKKFDKKLPLVYSILAEKI